MPCWNPSAAAEVVAAFIAPYFISLLIISFHIGILMQAIDGFCGDMASVLQQKANIDNMLDNMYIGLLLHTLAKKRNPTEVNVSETRNPGSLNAK